MSETYGEQEIGQPDERDEPADTRVPSSATEWVLGRTEPSPERQVTRDVPEQQEEGKSEGSGRPEDVAEAQTKWGDAKEKADDALDAAEDELDDLGDKIDEIKDKIDAEEQREGQQ